MRRLIRSSEMFAQIIMLTSLFGFAFWGVYMAFEALWESPGWFVAVTFLILLGLSALIDQGFKLLARITGLPYPRTHHIYALTAEVLDRDEEVDDWGSLHEIVEEYHNDVRFGGDGR